MCPDKAWQAIFDFNIGGGEESLVSLKIFVQCFSINHNPAGIYFFTVINEKTATLYEIYSELTIKTVEQRQQCSSRVYIANFKQVSHTVLVVPFWTLNTQILVGNFMLA